MKTCGTYKIVINIFSKKKKKETFVITFLEKKVFCNIYIYIFFFSLEEKTWKVKGMFGSL